ncbi:hypothetical protein E2C01_055337 [Portunus trituberculatus]|uniref:Uncharacterized protein n=1 Tax=Portunus trituberculatus TaxID=210409 RepID=A0A5B7GWI9_PORTR|nr:hypothetical protein [Portunus trituberculatus]
MSLIREASSLRRSLSPFTIYGVAMGCAETGTKLNKSWIDNRLMVPTKLTRSQVVVSDSTVAVGGSGSLECWSPVPLPFASPHAQLYRMSLAWVSDF